MTNEFVNKVGMSFGQQSFRLKDSTWPKWEREKEKYQSRISLSALLLCFSVVHWSVL